MGWCWWTSKVTDYSCHESTGDSAAKLCRVRQLTSSAAPPSLSSCSCNVRAGSSLMFCSGASGLTVNPRFSQGFQVVITPPPIRQRSIVMSVSVCLSLCVCLSLRDHISRTTRPIFTKFVAHVTYGRCSVLLWWRSDMLCTSGFMDDVIFACKPKLLDVAAQLKRSAHESLGLAINCAQ